MKKNKSLTSFVEYKSFIDYQKESNIEIPNYQVKFSDKLKSTKFLLGEFLLFKWTSNYTQFEAIVETINVFDRSVRVKILKMLDHVKNYPLGFILSGKTGKQTKFNGF